VVVCIVSNWIAGSSIPGRLVDSRAESVVAIKGWQSGPVTILVSEFWRLDKFRRASKITETTILNAIASSGFGAIQMTKTYTKLRKSPG
jgi:hypothetical protein